ncbi:hypothetical protein [Variovorax paradoxus]
MSLGSRTPIKYRPSLETAT